MPKGAERPVYINGIYCKSMTAGAKRASFMLKRKVRLYQIQRVLDGGLILNGLTVTDRPVSAYIPEQPVRTRSPMIRYPPGKHPSETWLPPQWR